MNISLERVPSRAWLPVLAMVIGSTGLGVASLAPADIEPMGDVAPSAGPVAGDRGGDVTGSPDRDVAALAADDPAEVRHDPGDRGGSERSEAAASGPDVALADVLADRAQGAGAGRSTDPSGSASNRYVVAHPFEVPLTSEPLYAVAAPSSDPARQTARLETDDGVQLYVETWLPAPKNGNVPPQHVPTILVATPYHEGLGP